MRCVNPELNPHPCCLEREPIMNPTEPCDYGQSIKYLYGLQKHGIKFGLNSTEKLLERVGNPHLSLKCIHVGGTNGKGSTSAMIASILSKHGYRVGLYTSPHLVRFTERFRIGDEEVAPERILDVFNEIRAHLNPAEHPTYFEMVTAMALLYFAQENVDFAVIEVGMGGRLDATNVIRPLVSVITNVSYDHQEYLGDTLTAIAREKAGIIKQEVPVVAAGQKLMVLSVLKTACWKMKAPLFILGNDFSVRRNANGTFRFKGIRHDWPALRVGLRGEHQVKNAALALCAVELLDAAGWVQIQSKALEEGLQTVHWPARLEIIHERPLMVLDGAHNPDGADSLRQALKKSFKYQRLHLIMGVMGDKDIRGIFRRLLPLADTAIFTQPRYARAADPQLLKKLARPYIRKHYVISDIGAAIEQAKQLAEPDDLICITGSLYFVGEVKEVLGEKTL